MTSELSEASMNGEIVQRMLEVSALARNKYLATEPCIRSSPPRRYFQDLCRWPLAGMGTAVASDTPLSRHDASSLQPSACSLPATAISGRPSARRPSTGEAAQLCP